MRQDLEKTELQRELKLLYSVVQAVSSLELADVLREILTVTQTVTQADSCLIYVLDVSTRSLVLRASKNPHKDLLKKVKLKVGEGITGWVAERGKPVAISSGAYKDPRFKSFSSLPEDRFEAFLSVPIVNNHGVVGVINVQHEMPHEHSKTEINLLSAIGNLVGGAIERAVLIEETLALKESLAMRKSIERAKGTLMELRGLSEKDAFRFIQKQSMDSRKSVKEICDAIILASEILPVDKKRSLP